MSAEQKIYDEKTAARIFLASLRRQEGVEWVSIRAEEKFPDLVNKTRWEFVAQRADSDEWIALEVKSLVFPEGESQQANWHRLVNDVNKRLGGRLPGKYWLAYLPRYTFDQAQRKTLVECLMMTVHEAAQTLGEGKSKDIGPSVAACFSHWPKDTSKQPLGFDPGTLQLLYPPHPLLLLRGSSDGNKSLGMGVGPVVCYWTEPTLTTAIIGLIRGKGKANAQLCLARDKGAARTVLLLDEHIDFDTQLVAKVLNGLDCSCLSSIDEVYLVSTFGGEHVQQVWPKVVKWRSFSP